MLTLGIKNYQKYAPEEYIVEIAGANNTVRAKNFKQEDISKIARIKLREQSPVMQTTAGRMAMGDALLAKGQADAQQYVNLVEGAPVDEIFEDQYDSNMAVKSEIESLLQGEVVVPHMLQDHPAFIREYKRILDNTPNILRGPLTQEILRLVEEHLKMEQALQLDPTLFRILRGEDAAALLQSMAQPQMPAPNPDDVLNQEPPTSQPANPAKQLETEVA